MLDMSTADDHAEVANDGVAKGEIVAADDAPSGSQHHSLKYHLLGPSLTVSFAHLMTFTIASKV